MLGFNVADFRNPFAGPTPAEQLITRRFHLVRHEDVSGMSGTGVVADGVQFPNGQTVISWRRPPFSLNINASIEDVIEVHGHDGRTCIEWID